MAQVRIGDALSAFLKSEKWLSRMHAIKIKSDWEKIMGKTIAKYTRDVKLKDGILIVSTDVAVLKQELLFGKQQVINNINEYFAEQVVKDVVIQ